MIIWNKRLYLDEIVARKPEKYKKLVDGRQRLHSCFLIVLAQEPDLSMEIYSTRELWFQYRRRQDMEVVGLAACRRSAFLLVEKIVSEVYREKGDVTAICIHDFFGDVDFGGE